MRQSINKFFIGLFALICLSAMPTFALAAEVAGSVMIVIGEAHITNESGQAQAIVKGQNIYAGAVITTGANGHVNLRMIDGAAVIVRASSKLKIEEYHVDLVTPANSRIKMNLESGVVRSITGRAGEASKSSYRLNTPLAAIGIRGTDFVVQADNDVTRVLVQSGAIVMTPLSANCSKESLGPCATASSRDLTAAMRNAYLEFRSKTDVPVFVPAEKALNSPNLLAPPRSDEPKIGGDKSAKNSSDSGEFVVDATRTAAVTTLKTKVDTAVVTVPVVTTPVVTVPVVTKPEVAPKIWWGRWAEFAEASTNGNTLSAQLKSDREVTSSGAVFGLLRQTVSNYELPTSGVASFNLADSESYVMSADKVLTAASVSSPKLTIDFGNRRYDTSLTVNGQGIDPVDITSKGRITFQGFFISELNSPDTSFDGSVISDGTQAGYIFQRMLTGGKSVIGATRWLNR
jgi:hypothetical protein